MSEDSKRYFRHNGWGGHECGFCGKVIQSYPYVIVGIVDRFPSGEFSEKFVFEAHERCARKMGLKAMNDEVSTGEVG